MNSALMAVVKRKGAIIAEILRQRDVTSGIWSKGASLINKRARCEHRTSKDCCNQNQRYQLRRSEEIRSPVKYHAVTERLQLEWQRWARTLRTIPRTPAPSATGSCIYRVPRVLSP